ncbi:MAG TPA: hypothetical protein PLJ00_03340 [Chitinophagales bacterium]|nr:hypothetical protein [Chitinophagales bacterium]HRG26901.1 hypothetical protein [Chitinophagales bacterium]HRG85209.1 hypothetical protein [Chitinophagales bacterium]HRH52267.1 hypothetical protein [Chitinophagales bacterium]
MLNRNKPELIFLAVFCVIAGIYFIIYYHFHVDENQFGAMGDSFGGFVGPVAAYFAAYFAYRTYQVQKADLKATTDGLKEERDNKKIQEVKIAIQEKIDTIADSFEFLKENVDRLYYKSVNKEVFEGVAAIEQIFIDLNKQSGPTHLMAKQTVKSLEVCNEIFNYNTENTMAFNDNKEMQVLLIWELILIYDSMFYTTYENYNMKHLFETSITTIKKLRNSGDYSNTQWLNEQGLTDLYDSVNLARANYKNLSFAFNQLRRRQIM